MNTKEVAIAWFERVWNQRDATAIPEMMHPDAQACTEGGTACGPDQLTAALHTPLLGAFPDLQVEFMGVIAEGADAVVRWKVTGTHGGDLLGIPATGRRVSFEGMTWLTIQDGRIVSGWDRWNLHALLGLLSQGSPAATAKFI